MLRFETPIDPFRPRGLCIAALAAAAGALAAREGGIAAAAVVALAALLGTLAVPRGRAGPWLLAVPAALAALPPPPALTAAPPPGPVRFEGTVLPGIRVERDRTILLLSERGHRFTLVVLGDCRALPGDVVRGVASADEPTRRARTGRPPLFETEAEAITVAPGEPSFARLTESCRLALQASLLRLARDERGALLCHLVLGHGPELPERIVAAHRATGLAHLLAVSGAHVALLAALLGLLGRQAAGRGQGRVYRRACAALLLVYGGITGMEPPVLRAVAAFLLALAAAAVGRRPSVAAMLAFPALLTALIAPNDLFTVGFDLSYAAVLGLALAGVGGGGGGRGRCERFVLAPLCASFWATLLTAPLTLACFGQLAPWTVLGTPLLAPLAGLLLVSGLALGTLGVAAPDLAAAFAGPLDLLTRTYVASVEGIAALPLAPVLAHSVPPPLGVAGFACLGLAVLAWRRDRGGVAALCVALSLPHFLPPLDTPAPRLQLLAIGHGQAALARLDDGRSVLVDCGSLGDPQRAARAAVQALRPRRALDVLVVTHADADHRNGVPLLLQSVAVGEAWLPRSMRDHPLAGLLAGHGAAVRFVEPGERTEHDPALTLFHPRAVGGSSNDESLWVRIEHAGASVLLAADAEEAGVDAAVEARAAAPADVLVLPHHGRANARVQTLLDLVEPQLALVSNREGEGASEQGRAARARGALVLATGTVGTITVRFDARTLRVVTEWPTVVRE